MPKPNIFHAFSMSNMMSRKHGVHWVPHIRFLSEARDEFCASIILSRASRPPVASVVVRPFRRRRRRQRRRHLFLRSAKVLRRYRSLQCYSPSAKSAAAAPDRHCRREWEREPESGLSQPALINASNKVGTEPFFPLPLPLSEITSLKCCQQFLETMQR